MLVEVSEVPPQRRRTAALERVDEDRQVAAVAPDAAAVIVVAVAAVGAVARQHSGVVDSSEDDRHHLPAVAENLPERVRLVVLAEVRLPDQEEVVPAPSEGHHTVAEATSGAREAPAPAVRVNAHVLAQLE